MSARRSSDTVDRRKRTHGLSSPQFGDSELRSDEVEARSRAGSRGADAARGRVCQSPWCAVVVVWWSVRVLVAVVDEVRSSRGMRGTAGEATMRSGYRARAVSGSGGRLLHSHSRWSGAWSRWRGGPGRGREEAGRRQRTEEEEEEEAALSRSCSHAPSTSSQSSLHPDSAVHAPRTRPSPPRSAAPPPPPLDRRYLVVVVLRLDHPTSASSPTLRSCDPQPRRPRHCA